MFKKFRQYSEEEKKYKKLTRLTIFYQTDYVKKLINSNFFDEDSNFSKHLYDYRTIVRRIRKEYEKIKALTKRRYIQLKIEINDRRMKTLLNSENKINFINRVIIKQLNLSFFFINKKTCDITNTKLKIFEIHFFIVAVIDKNNNQRFFEKFFLKININENLIFDMS